jgi:hypothetical protein
MTDMSQVVKFEGVVELVGDKKMVIPALSVKQVKNFRSSLAIIPTLAERDPTDEEVDQLMALVLAAIQRNYPEFTTEELEDSVDLNSLPRLVKAITGQSGLEKTTKVGEE